MVVVLRPKATSRADMSGVITPTRSSAPMTLSNASTSGFRMLCELATSTWPISRKRTNIRERELSSIDRDSRTVFGSIRLLRSRRAHEHTLELLDGLAHAVVEDL